MVHSNVDPTWTRLVNLVDEFRTLRHSAAAGLISSGASPKAGQTILGHASAAFTLTVYGQMFEADLDEVAARLERTLGEGTSPLSWPSA